MPDIWSQICTLSSNSITPGATLHILEIIEVTNLEIIRKPLIIMSLLFFLPSAQAQIALQSSIAVGVFADANDQDTGYAQASQLMSQGSTLNPMSVTATAQDFDQLSPSLSILVTASASASFVDASQGSVEWRNIGWDRNTNATSAARLNGIVASGPVWAYFFVATSDGLFCMDYDVRKTGESFGFQGVNIGWDGPGGGLDLTNAIDPTVHGTFIRPVVAGQEYLIRLDNAADIVTSTGSIVESGRMNADFSWKIQTVPEPSSLIAITSLCAMVLRNRLKVS